MLAVAISQLQNCLQSAETVYHRLVLLVGVSGSGKTQLLTDFAESFGVDVINVNLALSSQLLELTPRQRALCLPSLLDQIISESCSPVILDNLELLFDKHLRQDPLRLLQGLSRNRTILASWSGSASAGRLFYAQPGHPEYQSYDCTDVLLVSVNPSGADKKANHNLRVDQE